MQNNNNNIFTKKSYSGTTIWRIVGGGIIGIIISIIIIGTLFKIQSWPGSSFIFGMGFFPLIVIFFLVTYYSIKDNTKYYQKIRNHISLIGIVGILIIIVPEEIKVRIFYRKYPGYVNALLEAFKDSKNPKAWQKVEYEREKMNRDQR